MALRERLDREANRLAAPIGHIGGQGGGKENQVGYDAGKQVKGRKIHAWSTCSGLATITRPTYGDSTRTTAVALPVASKTTSSSLPTLRANASSPARGSDRQITSDLIPFYGSYIRRPIP